MQKLSILAALSAVLAVSQLSADIREADVTGGRVAGVSADGVVSFKGIPFAAPPVGSLRWRSPQPVKAWSRTAAGNSHGAGTFAVCREIALMPNGNWPGNPGVITWAGIDVPATFCPPN